MNEFFNGILLGLGVCVPFGPINILILTYALKSYKSAFCLGLGAFLADLLYLFIFAFSVTNVLKNEIFLDILSIFSSLFLIYLAFLMLRPAKTIDLNTKTQSKTAFKSFLKGFLINLANAYVITFWLSVSTMFSSQKNIFFSIAGLSFSIILWIFSLSFFIHKYTKFFNAKVLRIINLISAIVLIYFAVLFILRRFYDF